ncbi:L10-interacting MYB domain-containing protein [Camellia lanceoleosa]|uniref:L10-interacting MYB domain-containing protein n=1 Tax=Camellia lanceoleosa TaxID=1840588 RepID=A0ACC0H2C3_9ERIC|nr:L10-interacting MYB domain-containing protein [Camellia lanceoleosa]
MEHSQSPSTPSRHLRKRGGKQSQPQSRLAHKANWDSGTVRMFLQLVVKELDSGFKGSFHTITMHGYRAIAKAFEERTHKVHEVKQLQNKYASLKKDWQSWSHLMDSRHGPTGISYNEGTGLIQASDDWWAHYEKIDKNALKFKTKPLEHMELMRRVYEGATATGKFAWTPGVAFEPVATEDNPFFGSEEAAKTAMVCPLSTIGQRGQSSTRFCARGGHRRCTSLRHRQFRRDIGRWTSLRHRQFTQMTHQFTMMAHLRMAGANANAVAQHTRSGKKGQSVGASLLASSMENLASSVKLQQREVRVHHEYGDSASDCIRKCMARLYSLKGLDRKDPLILYGMALMDNPSNQAILLQLPTDAEVITWLRIKKSQNMGGPSVPTHGPWF